MKLVLVKTGNGELPRKTQPPLSPFVKGDNAGLNLQHSYYLKFVKKYFLLIILRMEKDIPLKSTYIRLLGYLRPYRHKVVIILILSAISSYIAVLPTQIVGVAVDEIKIADKYLKNTQNNNSDKIFTDKPQSNGHTNTIPISKPLTTFSQYIHKHWFESYNSTFITLIFLAAIFIFMHAANSGIMLFHGFITTELGQRLDRKST